MASAEVRQIRRRIKSVESTMKITRAMELIATARIGKAQVRVAQAKPYTEKMNDVIRNIAAATGSLSHPLLERREVSNIGVLVVTSDRGLAGGYNTSVIRFAEGAIRRHQSEGKIVRVYTIGAKAQAYFRYRKYTIDHSWLDITDTPTYGDARSIANIVLDEYASGRVDAVEAYTTEYISALTQTAISGRSSRSNRPRPKVRHDPSLSGTRSSLHQRRFSDGCFPATSKELCLGCCWKHQHQSTLPEGER